MGKESACNAGDAGDVGYIPGWRRSPGGGIPVFLPGESHEQRSLAGYCPWGGKQLDMIEAASTHTQEYLTLNSSGCSWRDTCPSSIPYYIVSLITTTIQVITHHL